MTVLIGPTNDIPACRALRRIVFIDEQNVPEAIEQDGRDENAHHILATRDGAPVGCARILIDSESGKIGRVCVLREHRRAGIGAGLIRGCLDHLRALPGVARAELGAQTYALHFYEKLGFAAFGPEFEDAGGQPHRMMARQL